MSYVARLFRNYEVFAIEIGIPGLDDLSSPNFHFDDPAGLDAPFVLLQVLDAWIHGISSHRRSELTLEVDEIHVADDEVFTLLRPHRGGRGLTLLGNGRASI